VQAADARPSSRQTMGRAGTHTRGNGANCGPLYYVQSGALSESFSDIFGRTIDLTDGAGNDSPSVRWEVGEDLPPPVGAIRNMSSPNMYDDPGKMSDAGYFKCREKAWTDPYACSPENADWNCGAW
jgi:hypothetical protein